MIDVNGADGCYGMALQPDGKIILCGDAKWSDSIVIMRLNADGSLDTSFSNKRGIFTALYGIWSSGLKSVIVKPDGKILACGDVNNNSSDFLLVQLLADGSLDSSFGTHGVVITPNTGIGHDFALQQDGKIVVAGRNLSTGGHLVRYHADGVVDSSFGFNGHVWITHPSGRPGPEQVEIDNNGKIYAAGYIDTGNEEMYLVRLNTDGSIDHAYAINGIITPLSTNNERAHALLLQQDGRVLVGGTISLSATGMALMRYWPYPLSVHSLSLERNTSIYPNPARDVLYLEVPHLEDGNYTIINHVGKVVQRGVMKDATINISNILKGMYILQITDRQSGVNTYTRFCKL